MGNDLDDGAPGTEEEAAPAPLPADDVDVKISNTGQRVRAILVAIIAVVAAVAAIYWYTQKQQEIQRHEDVKAAFAVAFALLFAVPSVMTHLGGFV